ncbi:hypothetical protein DS2_08770, partial [Catenovulum agarivorans DS-2]
AALWGRIIGRKEVPSTLFLKFFQIKFRSLIIHTNEPKFTPCIDFFLTFFLFRSTKVKTNRLIYSVHTYMYFISNDNNL